MAAIKPIRANTNIEQSVCDHYYQPKYHPAVVPDMNISRCIKCGIERWTHYDQVDEWKTNGLTGKQLMREGKTT